MQNFRETTKSMMVFFFFKQAYVNHVTVVPERAHFHAKQHDVCQNSE